MGIRRGTVLGLTGIAGALLEQELGLVGSAVMDVSGIGPLPVVVSWLLGVSLGVIAGDVVTKITGQDLNLGQWAGIKKGLIASVVAGLGYYASTNGLAAEFLGEYLRAVPGIGPAEVVKIGSIWLGGVLGDYFGA